LAAVVWTFLPSLRNGFVDYDDMLFVTGNLRVQAGISWSNLIWAFSHEVGANWHPLTILSHMLDCTLFGLKPWGHHLTNVLLHASNAVLLFLLFRGMTGATWRCAALALLFAVHPLRVESVTWISERKDVLSTFFLLLTLLAYARYARESEVPSAKSGVSYGLALAFFALGLMSKPMLVTLPFVLLLLDYWPLNRFGFQTQDSKLKTLLPFVREKLPFFALAAAGSALAYAVQAGALNIPKCNVLPLATRLANAVVSYCRYLGTIFWPVDLSPFYPYPASWGVAAILGSGLGLLVISVLVFFFGRERRYLAAGWCWFLGTLVPVIGLVQIGRQSMADHYTYIPGIGVLLMLVWGAHELAARWPGRRVVLSGLALAVALACVGLTRRQIAYWKDDETLWRYALTVTRNNDFAHGNLAFYLAVQKRFDEAIPHYEAAIRINPRDANPRAALAFALVQVGRPAEAIPHYEEALRLNPEDAAAQSSLGGLCAGQGRFDEAIARFTEALRLEPDFVEAHHNLGLALASLGRFREAAAQFQEVLRLKPDDANGRRKLDQMLAILQDPGKAIEAYRDVLRARPADVRAQAELGRVLLESGRLDEALEHLTAAARQSPKSAETQYQFGAALSRKGEVEKAARQFELALRLEPKFAPAHYALGILRQHQGQVAEALQHWREAARLAPQWADPLNNLAWVLATNPRADLRNGPEAVKLAERAVELTGTNTVGMLDTLAAAYAEAGRFAEARSTARRAQATAAAKGQEVLAGQIGRRSAFYAAQKPYRDTPDVKP